MYEAFYELKHKPFSLLPDPEFLFLSDKHAVALSLLEYSLTGQAGFCVITGEIGSGKTTLLRAFLKRIDRDFTVGLISNTHSSLRDVASWVLTSFGQKPLGVNPAETFQELIAFLIAEYGAGRQCILIVDEAQNLTIEALEELRLLSNINSGKDLLLQMVLIGQPELLQKLRRPELVQFAQRISVSHHLAPLSYSETRRYILHRLAVAGAGRPIFTEMAMGAVQYFSGGVPRLINSICDLALVYGFADGKFPVDEAMVLRVVGDRQNSGIAPFARSESPDDPSILVEIGGLARAVAEAENNLENHTDTPNSRSDFAPVAAIREIETSGAPVAAAPIATAPAVTTQAASTPVRASASSAGQVEPLARQFAEKIQNFKETSGDLYFVDTVEEDVSALSSNSPDPKNYTAPLFEYSQPLTVKMSLDTAVMEEQPRQAPSWANMDPVDSKSWPSITGRQSKIGSRSGFSASEPELAEPRRSSWWRRSFLRN